MCGIAFAMSLTQRPIPHLRSALTGMNDLLAHRGPDGSGHWVHPDGHVGFTHRRLSIIGFENGDQPMTDGDGNWIICNGEIYNYQRLRESLGADRFSTDSDIEV